MHLKLTLRSDKSEHDLLLLRRSLPTKADSGSWLILILLYSSLSSSHGIILVITSRFSYLLFISFFFSSCRLAILNKCFCKGFELQNHCFNSVLLTSLFSFLQISDIQTLFYNSVENLRVLHFGLFTRQSKRHLLSFCLCPLSEAERSSYG